jgi:hypothetical protein
MPQSLPVERGRVSVCVCVCVCVHGMHVQGGERTWDPLDLHRAHMEGWCGALSCQQRHVESLLLLLMLGARGQRPAR